MMNKVEKLSNPNCNIPLTEILTAYLKFWIWFIYFTYNFISYFMCQYVKYTCSTLQLISICYFYEEYSLLDGSAV
jgi:hypothetical protein